MMMAANRRHVYGNASIYDVASRRSTFPLPLNPRARQELSGKLTNTSPSNTSRESSSGSSFHILPLPYGRACLRILSHNLILRELIGNQPTKLDFLIESECHRDRIINLVLIPL